MKINCEKSLNVINTKKIKWCIWNKVNEIKHRLIKIGFDYAYHGKTIYIYIYIYIRFQSFFRKWHWNLLFLSLLASSVMEI